MLLSCSAISDIFNGNGVVKVKNKQRMAYYDDFLKDTLHYGVYIHTLKNKEALVETRAKFAGFPEAYIFDKYHKNAFFVSCSKNTGNEINALNQRALDSLTSVDFELLQDFRKLVLMKTKTVFAHDNLFMQETQKHTLDVYLLCNTKVGKKELKKLENLRNLQDLATIHILDLSLQEN
ncbi:hypothetical protein NBRC110019_21500 [Neptunitalea chrysea]|uniref:Uncharacterized protein n=2 Tax=Neptunitalea chrysea TaxID=1647581 RepID=A0A9W6B5U3_9FLAO|nr:hypothetical protein NBRC110019_21500 [Neptunitalea chrysea]